MNSGFKQIRHKLPLDKDLKSELIIACMQLRTNANLSAIIRTAGCCGIKKVIVSGQGKVEKKIARDGADNVTLEIKRSLLPTLLDLKKQGYTLVGLEQTNHSIILKDYTFSPKSVLVIGNERTGITQEILDILDDVVEIPVYGIPFSYNVATATSMALYEYRRQQD